MLYELRIYHMHPGRLPAINKRFKDHTLDIFKRHNIRVCDFFEDAEGAQTIYYVCAFDDRKQRDEAWASFRNDPQWKAVSEASQADGPIVERVDSYFMTRVPYIKPDWESFYER